MNLLSVPYLCAWLWMTMLSVSQHSEPKNMFYGDKTLQAKLTMSHDIYTGADQVHRSHRIYEMNFTLISSPDDLKAQVTLNETSGNIEVHGMTERLSTAYLKGLKFNLARSNSKHQFNVLDGQNPELDMGQSFIQHPKIGSLLTTTFPVLAQEKVDKNTTWQSQQPITTLVGWSWAQGDLYETHQIQGIELINGQQIVTVKTHGKATLVDANSARPFVGEGQLSRQAVWTFNLDQGKLLELTAEQTIIGENMMQRNKPTLPIKVTSQIALKALDEELSL